MEFISFHNEPTYLAFLWLSKNADLDAMIAAAKERIMSEVEKSEWPDFFSDKFTMADELSHDVEEKLYDLQQCAEGRGLEVEMWSLDDDADGSNCVAAILGHALNQINPLIVAKAILIKAAGWQPSKN